MITPVYDDSELIKALSENLQWALSRLDGGPDESTAEYKTALRMLGVAEGVLIERIKSE